MSYIVQDLFLLSLLFSRQLSTVAKLCGLFLGSFALAVRANLQSASTNQLELNRALNPVRRMSSLPLFMRIRLCLGSITSPNENMKFFLKSR